MPLALALAQAVLPSHGAFAPTAKPKDALRSARKTGKQGVENTAEVICFPLEPE
jgi:hypothetical protein